MEFPAKTPNTASATPTRKINIVFFWFHNDWGQYGRAYEQIAKAMAELPEVEKVVCTFPPRQQKESHGRPALKIRKAGTNLTLLEEAGAMPSKPRRRNGIAFLRYRLHKFRSNQAFKTFFAQNNIHSYNTILWLFPPHPYIHRLLEVVPRMGVVTQVIDDFTKFDPAHTLYLHAHCQYPEIGQWSDLIFVTSMANLKKFSATGRPCRIHLPAVDPSFLGKPTPLPHKLSHKAPRLGYLGFIMERTDLELIRHIACERPQWDIVLAGPEYPEGHLAHSGLLGLPNITHLGTVSQQKAPEFLQSLDVCLLPHHDNEYSQSMGPLKLYQYLASGRPVVATDVAGLELVRDCIHIGSDQHEFLAKIELALEADTLEFSEQRIRLAAANTWAARVREMLADIITLIPEAQPSWPMKS